MNKDRFKKGDKVVFSAGFSHKRLKEGDELEIIKCDRDGVPKVSDSKGCQYFIDDMKTELVINRDQAIKKLSVVELTLKTTELALGEAMGELKSIRGVLEKPEEVTPEVGKWYKSSRYNNSVVFFESKVKGYGISSTDTWWHNDGWDNLNSGNWELATNYEVECMLIKEAEKRGFKKGVEFISAAGTKRTIGRGRFKIWEFGNTRGLHHTSTNGLILDNGNWAEIIKQPEVKEMTVAQVAEAVGHPVKIIE